MEEELSRLDSSFNRGMFITKVNNIFVMLHSAIMMGNIDRVRHFLSDDLEQKYEAEIKALKDKNVTRMFDELNVKTTTITDIQINDNVFEIDVDIVSRYMDYFIDRDTGKFVSGINDHRIEKMNHLVFTKKRGANYSRIAQKCPGCGANIDVNNSGKCLYCGAVFDAEDYDWILTSIETLDV